MKSLKIMFLLLAALLLFGCGSGAETKEESSEESGTQIDFTETIEFDKVAFEEGELLGIYNSLGEPIAYFEWIDNPAFEQVKGIKLYDKDKVERYVLMPRDELPANTVYIKRVEDGSKGSLKVTQSYDYMKVFFECKLSFFGEPYNFNYNISYDTGFFVTPKTYIDIYVYYNEEKVFYREEIFSSEPSITNKVSAEFVERNPLEVALFTLTFELEKEVRNSRVSYR